MKSLRTIKTCIGRLGLARVAPLLAVFFVAAQLIVTAHAAAFGGNEHTHDGHPCIIVTACKHAPDLDTAKPFAQLETPDWQVFYGADDAATPCPVTIARASARSPPSLI